MSDKMDLSFNCNFDDDDTDNNCFGCTHFIFPIGCMFFENHDWKENEMEIENDN